MAAGELALSLYLDPALLRRLEAADPLERLHGGNVADCLTALEGVSHFLYLVWNASHDRAVSLLELEMQAEVDKFIVSHWLLRRQVPGHFPAGAAAGAVRARRESIRTWARGRGCIARPAATPGASVATWSARCSARAAMRSPPGEDGAAAGRAAAFLPLQPTARKRAHIEQTA